MSSECPLIKSRKYKLNTLAEVFASTSNKIRFPDDNEHLARMVAKEPKAQKKCEDNRRLGKQIIVDKMHKVDTFIGRAFTNMFVWGNFTDSIQVRN